MHVEFRAISLEGVETKGGITEEGERFRIRHPAHNRRIESRSNPCRERSRRGRTLRCLATTRNRNGASA